MVEVYTREGAIEGHLNAGLAARPRKLTRPEASGQDLALSSVRDSSLKHLAPIPFLDEKNMGYCDL